LHEAAQIASGGAIEEIVLFQPVEAIGLVETLGQSTQEPALREAES